MANCRKCGAKRITKISAGVFNCKHCGRNPGQTGMDRAGFVKAPEDSPTDQTYTFED